MTKLLNNILSNKVSGVNILFCTHVVVIVLVITGILPRAIVPFWTLVLVAYVLWATLEDSTAFFVRSIPFFIAIPISAGFDSLNMWRVLSGLIFLKWVLPHVRHAMSYMYDMRCRTVCFLPLGLLLFAILSIIQAQSQVFAIK